MMALILSPFFIQYFMLGFFMEGFIIIAMIGICVMFTLILLYSCYEWYYLDPTMTEEERQQQQNLLKEEQYCKNICEHIMPLFASILTLATGLLIIQYFNLELFF